MLRAQPDAGVLMFYDGTKRVETTSVGMNVIGNVDCDSINNAGISTFAGDVQTQGDVSIVDKIYHSGDTNTMI